MISPVLRRAQGPVGDDRRTQSTAAVALPTRAIAGHRLASLLRLQPQLDNMADGFAT